MAIDEMRSGYAGRKGKTMEECAQEVENKRREADYGLMRSKPIPPVNVSAAGDVEEVEDDVK